MFGKWVSCISGSFLLIGVVGTVFFDSENSWGPLLSLQNLFHLLGTLVPAGVWLRAIGRPMSRPTLRAVDAASVVATCVFFGSMGASISQEPIIATFVSLLAAIQTVVFRAIVVPSTATRTAWISALSFAPIVAASVYLQRFGPDALLPRVGTDISIATWCVSTTSVTALASHVIFGLRREVRHARQLGQYTIERKIGEGGIGAVCRASHVMLRATHSDQVAAAGQGW